MVKEERSPRRDLPLVFLAACAVAAPLLGGRILAGHDVATYLMYAAELAAGFSDGVLLPSITPELNAGFGGPGLLFYPPIVHFFHAMPLFLGVPAPIVLSLVSLAGVFLSGCTAWLWFSEEGDREAALLGTLVYMAAPYRLLDLYERTNLSEHWAFVFAPLLFVAASRERWSSRVAVMAVAVAGLLLTNTPLALLFGLLFVAFAASPLVPSGGRLSLLCGALLGLALGAFLLAGQSLAGAWTRTEIWYGATAARGFRPTENGLFSSLALDREFNVRVSLVIVGTFLLIALGVLGEMGSRRGRSNERFFWGGAGLLALLSTLPGAGVVWEAVPVLSKLQFPWRVGAVLTLIFSALLVKVQRRSLRFVLTFTVLAAALPFLGSSTTSIEGLLSPRTPKAAPSAACTVAPSPEAVATAWGDVSNLWMRNPLLLDVWYVPRSAAPGLVAEVFGDGAPIYPALRRQVAFAPAEPDAPVRVVTCRHPNREVEIELQSASQVVLRAFFFPGFTVRVDRRLVSAEQDPRSGLLSVSLPAGVHRVEWSWAAPPRVFFARGVSGFSLIVLSALVLMAGFRKEEKAAPRS